MAERDQDIITNLETTQRRHMALMLAVRLNATLGTVDINAVLQNAARFNRFLKDGTTTAP